MISKIKSKLKLLTILLLGLTALLFLVGCKEPIPTSLEIDTSIERIEVIEGENLGLEAFSFFAVYKNGSREEIDKSLLNLSGFDSSIEFLSNDPVKQTLTFSYLNLSTSFDIYIVPRPIDNIMVLSGLGKVKYTINEEINLADISVVVNYKDGQTNQFPLTMSHISNLDNLELDGNKLTKIGNFELDINYRGVSASNSLNISVNKYKHQDEAFEVLSNETTFDPNLSYTSTEVPNLSKVVVSSLSNGQYKIIESIEGEYELEDLNNLEWLSSNTFNDLKPNQEYTIIGRQGASDTFDSGNTYQIVVKTKPLETPKPKILEYGYNYIEVERLKYVKYTLNRASQVETLDDKVIFKNLNPNEEYTVTAKYLFNDENNRILSSEASQKITQVDNPFVSIANQSYVYNNENFNYQLTLKDEFADAGNIITEIRYNNLLEVPKDVGTYQVTIKHRFSPNELRAGSLFITKRNVTLKVLDSSKDYLDLDPNFNFEVEGELPSGEDISIFTHTFNRVQGESVNTYDVILVASNPNYNIITKSGTLTINKKLIYAKVDDLTKVYGQALPDRTYQFIGAEPVFHPGDDSYIRDVYTETTPGIFTNNTLARGTYYDEINLELFNSSYEIIVNNKGTIIVTPFSLTVNINSATKVYGAVDPAFSYTLSNENYRSQADIKLTRQAGNRVGQYEIRVSSYNSLNFDLNINSNNLEITKANITFKVNDFSITYGQNYQEKASLSVINGYIIGTDTLNSFDIKYQDIASNDVGTYQISAVITNPNYNVIVQSGILNITKKTVRVVPDYNQEKIYGENDPIFTYTVSSVENDNININLDREPGEDVGNYQFILSTTLSHQNYQLELENRTFRIKPRPSTVTANLLSKEYGSVDPELTYKFSNLAKPADASLATGALTRVAGENVGEYQVRLGTLKLPNYTLEFVGSNFTINPKPITINYNLLESYTYGENVDLTKAVANLLDGEYINLQGYNIQSGTHQIMPVIKNSSGRTITSNYNIANPSFELVVNKAELLLKPIITTKVYSQDEPVLRYSIDESGLKYNDRQSVVSGSLLREAGEDVGNYNFITTDFTAVNYNISLTTQEFTITPKEIVVTYQKNYTYNQNVQELIITNDISSSITYTTTPAEFKLAGKYQVAFATTNNNYVIANSVETATIEKQIIDITINNANKKVGDDNPIFSADLTPLEALDESFNEEDLVLSTTANSTSPSGTYLITVENGFTSNNYHFQYIYGLLIVADYNLDIKTDYIYNGLARPLIVKILNNNNVDITSSYTITLIYQGGIVPTNAGTYLVDIKINDGTNDTIISHTQVISKREMTIDYHIGDLFEYGDAYSNNQGTSENLLQGHRIEFSGDMNGLGVKTLTARVYNESSQEVTNNYNITNSTHTFEIVKATLTIKPLVTSKVYGNLDPEFVFSATGFKKGETISIINGSLSRELGEDVETYLFLLDNLSTEYYNFIIDQDNKYFTINKRVITVDYNLPSSITYGDDLTINPSANNLRSGDVVKLLGFNTNFGNHHITPQIVDSADNDVTLNYQISNPTFNLEVTKKELVVTPNQLSKTYGSDDQPLTYEVSGYVGSDNDLIAGSLSREAGEVVGTYNILIGSLTSESPNYQISLQSEVFTINKKAIFFTTAETSYTYKANDLIISLDSDDLQFNDKVVITSEPFKNAGTYELTVKIINNDDVDVSSSYLIDNNSLKVVVLPKVIYNVTWSYDNEVATASSIDLEGPDQFTYINNDNLIPGTHTAKIVANSNYQFDKLADMSYEYTHIGNISEALLPQTVIYNGLGQKYDTSYLVEIGYTVLELENPLVIDVNDYEVKLKLELEYYYSVELTTTFKVTPKEVVATYNYFDEYTYNDSNYLDNSLVTLSENLTPTEYQIINILVDGNNEEEVSTFKQVGTYKVYYVINNTNYKASEINYKTIKINPMDIEVQVNNQLLIEGEDHNVPSYHSLFEKTLDITYSITDYQPEDTSVSGIVTGQKVVTISKIILSGEDVTNQFNIISKNYLYTVLSKDYFKLLDYNKDDSDRDENTQFSNGFIEAVKNPIVGFGYRYHNKYYANKYYANKYHNGVLNSNFDDFSTNYYYKYGNRNNAVIQLSDLFNLDSNEFNNIRIDGLGVTIIGLKVINLDEEEIESSARIIKHGLEVAFRHVGKQTITISYEKYGIKIPLAKLNIEVVDGFTNISTYEELFNSNNITEQNIILNNGIAYKQTLGITINVNADSTLYGNNYEINSYSASYSDTDKPELNGKNLLHTKGLIDNVRIIQRRATSYDSASAPAGATSSTINRDTAVNFEGGIIRNSFIAYGRETVEITSTISDLLIENSTILGGPFGIRRRSTGKLTLDNVKIIQRPDLDKGGMGIPLVYLSNSGVTINTLNVDQITLEVVNGTKFYGFETLKNLKNATLPFGVKEIVGDIIEELWTEYESELVYYRGSETVMSPSVLFVSKDDIKSQFDQNPITGYADTFQHAYRDISITSAYGYVYTYNRIDKDGENERYTQKFIEDEDLLNPPAYYMFTGEYQGD